MNDKEIEEYNLGSRIYPMERQNNRREICQESFNQRVISHETNSSIYETIARFSS